MYQKQVKTLISNILNDKKFKSILEINFLTFDTELFLEELHIEKFDYIRKRNIIDFKPDEIHNEYDLIIGILPIGLKKTITLDKYKLPANYDLILKSTNYLSTNGLGLYLVEPSFFWTSTGRTIINVLNHNNFYISSCFHLPQGILKNSNLRPYLIGIERNITENLFIADIDNEDNIEIISKNFALLKNSNNIETGKILNISDFEDFSSERIKKEKDIILQHYENVNFISFEKIIDSLTVLKTIDQIKDDENALLLSKQGKISFSINPKNPSNNFLIKINKEFALSDYIVILFKSNLGELLINSIKVGITIPYIRKNDLLKLNIPLPELEKQKEIVMVNKNFQKLKSKINEIENELSLNLNNAELIHEKIQDTLNKINDISDNDRIVYFLRQGESEFIEFKESFALNVKEKFIDNNIELSALKTIVAFLNTDGGILLIGVDDNSNIKGVDYEIQNYFKNSEDKYLLYIKDKIKTKIGIEFIKYIKYRIVSIQERKILFFEIERSKIPCCYEEKDFYIRVNPATEKIAGKKLIEYLFNKYNLN